MPSRPHPAFHIAHGLPKDQRAGRRRPEQLNTILQQLPLLIPAEQVQHHAEMENVCLTHHAAQGATIAEVKNIRLHQRRPEGVPVPEEVVPKPYESLLQLRAVQVSSGRAVVHQLADVLADAAADVEVRRAAPEALQDSLVRGLLAQAEVEETELSYAGVGEDVPCLVAL